MRLGTLLPDVRVAPPGPRSRALAARLARVESRNVTHVSERWPIFWDAAAGANVLDADGNVYIDLTSAFGVALLGHGCEAVQDAIDRQRRSLIHGMGDVHPPTVKLELLERLAAIAPWGEARTVLASTGSEAVEVALKTARLASDRPGIVAFEGAYHGLTLGALAATERALFRGPFEARLYGGVAFAPFPDPLRDAEPTGAASLRRVMALLESGAPNGDAIGTILVEPVQARAGARIPPPGFMAALSDLAAAHDVLVVADEVLTGLGRCGAMFASERLGLRPDLICLGKVLGGGMPVSACMAPARVMDAWPPSAGEAIHTSTFLGHPLACSAAIAVLDVLATEGVAARAERVGTALLDGLQGRLASVPCVADVRGLGLLVGIELTAPDKRVQPAGRATVAAERLLGRGVLTVPAGAHGEVLDLTPPITLTEAQTEHVIGVIADVLGACS